MNYTIGLLKRALKLGVLLVLPAILCAENFEAKVLKPAAYKHPKRDVSVIIGPEGYYPNNFIFYLGEEVTFYFTSITHNPSCVLFPQDQVYLGVANKEIIEKRIQFDKLGKYEFYCPTGNIRAKISIIEHPAVLRELERKRELASKRNSAWMPK